MLTHFRSVSRRRRAGAFTLVELLVVIAIIGVLVALLLPAVNSARESARRTQCSNNLKNIALACLNYETAKRELPRGSINAPGYSQSGMGWTVQILPYIEQSGVSEQSLQKYRTAKDFYGASYDLLNGLLLPMYLCPSDQELPLQSEKQWTSSQTAAQLNRKGMSYAGVSGSYYARTGRCPGTRDEAAANSDYCVSADLGFFGANNFDGLIIMDWPVKLKDVTDGVSNTFMISERTYQIRAWMIGAYWRDSKPVRVGNRVDGPQAITALFAMKNLSDKVRLNHDPIRDGFYIAHDNALGDRPEKPNGVNGWVTVNDLPFASYHSGGVNFALGDGGVRFVSENIDVATYLAYGSRNGDEIIVQQ